MITYTVRVSFQDESEAKYEGLSQEDLLAVINTFDKLNVTQSMIIREHRYET